VLIRATIERSSPSGLFFLALFPPMPSPDPASQRLFIGLWPPPEAHAALLAHADAWTWPASARRTQPGRLHVTLHFLGQVAAGRIADLREGLAVQSQAFELVLDRQEVWPGGIAVLEAGTVPPPLAALHAALAQRLAGLGLPLEARRYRPHVTLARKAAGARPPPSTSPVHWRAGPRYALVRSLPGGRGYEILQSFG
jgi:RNA 2',3'-cyclic 3'-phosphodiesterase